MKKFIIVISLIVLFRCSFVFGQSRQVNIPTEEQVQKLAEAAWKEPITSIDILYYEDHTGVPEPVEQIRKRAEEIADREFKGRSIDELEPYEKERRDKNIEINFKNWLKNQAFPRKIKEHVWISGDQQRTDSVKVGPDELLDESTPFAHTFINTKDANTGNFVSYHYASEMKTVFVRPKKWAKKMIGEFAGIPIAGALQAFLGIDQGSTPTSPNYIPDPDKMSELARTGLVAIESIGGIKTEKPLVNRISIYPDSNTPGTRDIIKMGDRDPNLFPAVVLICDRNDYSHVYRTEFHVPTTNQLIYTRECNSFDSQGFPHDITEIQYELDGSFKEKSVYRVMQVKLNLSIADDVFEFNPPQGYKVVDERPPK